MIKTGKKQLAALQRILNRENEMYDPEKALRRPGLHICGSDYLITDGQISVILAHKLENVPAGSCMDSLARVVRKECDCGNYHLLSDIHPESDPVELTITDKGKILIRGQFDAQCLRDALDIAGSGATFYLGSLTNPFSSPSLLVLPSSKNIERGIRIIRIASLKQPYEQDKTIYGDGIYRAAGCEWTGEGFHD